MVRSNFVMSHLSHEFFDLKQEFFVFCTQSCRLLLYLIENFLGLHFLLINKSYFVLNFCIRLQFEPLESHPVHVRGRLLSVNIWALCDHVLVHHIFNVDPVEIHVAYFLCPEICHVTFRVTKVFCQEYFNTHQNTDNRITIKL